MKRAVLHIGTEKTGTTSIQLYLFKNRLRLEAAGFLFPMSCDYLSNRKLTVYAQTVPSADLIYGLDFASSDTAGHARWKTQFVDKHCNEVTAFQAKHPDGSTVVYSSEHLQSRLPSLEEIERVRSLLMPLFDQVEIIVYLRRQDRFALSAHSTTLRAGCDTDFSFESINANGPYYDHLKLLQDWSEVFGEEAMATRIFERRHLKGGDVVADFCAAAGLPFGTPQWVVPEAQNEALSHTAQSVLRCFNRMKADDARLLDVDQGALRGFLLEELEKVDDDHGKCLPARASAEAFMGHFAEANRQVSERWLAGKAFDSDFEAYPETASNPPVIADAENRLEALITAFRERTESRNVQAQPPRDADGTDLAMDVRKQA